MQKHTLILFCVIILTVGTPASTSGRDDFKTWQSLSAKIYDSDKLDALIYTETRIGNDFSRRELALINPILLYNPRPNLTLGINYTYLDVKPLTSCYSSSQHWLAFEATPAFTLTRGIKVSARQRLEIRWIENQMEAVYISRHQFGLSVPIQGKERIKRFFASEEIFYDYNRNRFSENRAIPVGIGLKLTRNINLDIYGMIFSKCSSGGQWEHSYVLGMHFKTDFTNWRQSKPN